MDPPVYEAFEIIVNRVLDTAAIDNSYTQRRRLATLRLLCKCTRDLVDTSPSLRIDLIVPLYFDQVWPRSLRFGVHYLRKRLQKGVPRQVSEWHMHEIDDTRSWYWLRRYYLVIGVSLDFYSISTCTRIVF